MIKGMDDTFGIHIGCGTSACLEDSPYVKPLSVDETPRKGDLVFWGGHVVCYYPGAPSGKDVIGARQTGKPFNYGNLNYINESMGSNGKFYRIQLPDDEDNF